MSSLVDSINNENIKQVDGLLKLGYDPNQKVRGVTPLHAAIYKGNYDIVNLLSSHPDISIDIPSEGYTPYELAELLGYEKIQQLLLERGADDSDIIFEPFDTYVEGLSSEQRKSLYMYTASCTVANTLIRKGKKLIGANKGYYSNILEIFRNGPNVKTPITVYRGVDENDPNNCKNYSGFISTSSDKYAAKEFVGQSCCLYEILVPPGDYSILPLISVSEYPQENEILLPPGSIEITGKKDNNHYTCVYIHKGNTVSFEYSTGNTSNEFYSIEEWVKRISKSVTPSIMKKANDTFKKLNTESGDYTIDRYRNSILISVLSDLDYFNDVPEEAISMYLDTLILPYKKTYMAV